MKKTIKHPTQWITLSGAMAIMLSLSGCLQGTEAEWEREPLSPPAMEAFGGQESGLSLSEARGSGTIAGYEIGEESYGWDAYSDYGALYIELRSESEDGTTMQGLWIHRGFDELEPGQSFDVNDDNYDDYSEYDYLPASMILCASEDDGQTFPFEDGYNDLHVDILEGPTEDSLLIQWDADLSAGGELAGSVVVER